MFRLLLPPHHMGRNQLTAKQYAFLKFLVEYVRAHQVWPTYGEISERFGYRSPNSVTQNYQALHRKGYLERDEHGYCFADSGPAGGLPVEAKIEAGRWRPVLRPEPLSLQRLFRDCGGTVKAFHVTQTPVKGVAVPDGAFLLLQDGPLADGEVGAVLHDGEIHVRRVWADGGQLKLTSADGRRTAALYVDPTGEGTRLLGRFVGHASSAGVVRHVPPKASAARANARPG